MSSVSSSSPSFSSSSSSEECRSPVGLDGCSCCLDLANRGGLEGSPRRGCSNNNLRRHSRHSPAGSPFLQLREQLVCQENLNADKLSRFMRQDSLEPVVRDPCFLRKQGICNRNIDQTLLSILLLFHRQRSDPYQELSVCQEMYLLQAIELPPPISWDPTQTGEGGSGRQESVVRGRRRQPPPPCPHGESSPLFP